MTNKLKNLSKKKQTAWLKVRSCECRESMDALVQEYQQLRKLTKEAAEKARNAWWSARAVEAEKLA